MAQTKTLSNFKSRLAGGGARPNLFEVTLPSFPGAAEDFWGEGENESNTKMAFLCKAAQLPASTVAEIPVAFRGRQLKVAGERTFDPWTVTIINDEDFGLRTSFEAWMNKLSKLNDATGVTNPTSYMTNAYVKQLGRGKERFATENVGGESSILRTYKFYDIWPTNVSAIQLSYDTEGTIEEFDVTFAVQYFTIGETEESGSSDDQVGTIQ
tara:strand:+ start:1403 stop:2035 length:633 start_codon:yes stop_codon:yes gene_type:complete